MAKRRHKQEKQESPKTYNIKMPVYTTSMMEQEDGLFGKATDQDMISLLKDRLKSFSSPISTDNRNKTKKMVIKNHTDRRCYRGCSVLTLTDKCLQYKSV